MPFAPSVLLLFCVLLQHGQGCLSAIGRSVRRNTRGLRLASRDFWFRKSRAFYTPSPRLCWCFRHHKRWHESRGFAGFPA